MEKKTDEKKVTKPKLYTVKVKRIAYLSSGSLSVKDNPHKVSAAIKKLLKDKGLIE